MTDIDSRDLYKAQSPSHKTNRLTPLRCAVLIIGTFLAIIGGIVGYGWLHFNEPWYETTLVRKIAQDPGRIGDIFQNGMPREQALKILNSNGFSCTSSITVLDVVSLPLICKRRPNTICAREYTVTIHFDQAGVIASRADATHFDCM